MSKELATVDSGSLWKGHLKVKGRSPVPSEKDYDIWRANSTGVSMSDIMETFDVSRSSADSSCKKVEKFFESRVAVDVASLKLRQHMGLEALKLEALEEYQKSGGVVRTITRKRKAVDGMEDSEFPDVIEETIVEKRVSKDPRFLTLAKDFYQEQRKIWPGANAPSASTITNTEGPKTQINIAQFAKDMTPEQEEIFKQAEKLLANQDKPIDV